MQISRHWHSPGVCLQCHLLGMPAVGQLEEERKYALVDQLLNIFLTHRLDADLDSILQILLSKLYMRCLSDKELSMTVVCIFIIPELAIGLVRGD